MEVSSECRRTQNIVVTNDFITSLKRAMNWGKKSREIARRCILSVIYW